MDTTLSAPIGQLLDGRYLVESQLARGGMATVYHARDVRLERPVALKIAHPELARDEGFIARFISEARSVARLSSPNVVAVFDQGSTGDLYYIAMEYVPGPTLRELLVARGRLQPREALDIIERVLSGLAAAHEAGIIHRDVKPENVLLGNGTSVKVADFGLARAASGVSHTRTGLLIGTAAYLAPEQVASSTSDERTDVYAAGVMLFEMLTGVQPHTGESPLAVAYKHVNAVVPAPSSIAPELPSALDTLVALATSRDPDLRPPDARHYLRAITQVRRGLPLPSMTRRDGPPADPSPDALGAAWPPGDAVAGSAAGAETARAGTTEPAESTGAVDTAVSPEHDIAAGHDLGLAGLGFAGRGFDDAGFDAGFRPAGDATGPLGAQTAQLRPASAGSRGDGQDQRQHTMIVPAGPDEDYRPVRSGRRSLPEPLLQRWLFSRRILIVLAVVLLGAGAWWLTAGQYLSVPSVVGLTAGAARSELSNAGLVAEAGHARHSDTVKAGLVLATDPGPGARVSHGAKVVVVTSLGPVLISVPPVTGQGLEQADKALLAAGLRPAPPTYQTSASIPAGVVISTSPIAYQHWPQDKPVHLVVSQGPPLPDFVGQSLSAAQAAAAGGGYSINPVTVAQNKQPAGTILRQSPRAGQPVTSGEVVTVWVSPGPPEVAVPDVQGMNVHQAEQALTSAGFQVSVDQTGLGNRVMSYSPTGQAPQGSTITIVVGFTF